ncbi:MAG: hypothetical protein D3925_03915 [Candidatus Electrothrix sp. AR5]|nr:hypothetical protein [Candidatus Electrothrix sp. AR5]MCI5137320.1 hypothetical protein [Candidatus Electrothrix sp. AR1]
MDEKKKLNCWEYKKCGREPGGKNVSELGVCPVTVANKGKGIHQGKNGGRCCWVVAGSLCKGELQGTFAKKHKDCHKCDFYKMVKEEEQPNFEVTISILKKLR